VQRVLGASVNLFFDVCPTGRIINRFSADIDRMDIELPETLANVTQNAFRMISCVAVCALSTPWVLLCLLPISIAFYSIFAWFRPTSRELKRMEGVSRSPIFGSFAECLQGLETIRAFGKQARFAAANDALIDANVKFYLIFWMCGRWLGTRLDCLCVATTLSVSFLAVMSVAEGLVVNEVLVGLALVYAMQLAGLAQFTVRQMIEVESHMVSVERLNALSNVPQERSVFRPSATTDAKDDARGATTVEPAAAWPSEGAIEFQRVSMRYRPGLELVLRSVSVSIAPGQKVGICGRTGSGKSSFMLTLLRMVELDSGRIVIDGHDIASVPLATLRRRLSIIPQEPVLFSGTLRFNLDPFEQFDDAQLWQALDRVDLGAIVRRMGAQLLEPVTEGGGNYSVGQRQLICIARALLRNSKLVLLDEATASVDSTTDALIQRTIRDNFGAMTVLTIAHRIQTIVDSDRALVLDSGEVAEYASPEELLKLPGGIFRSLVEESQRQQQGRPSE